MDLFKIITDNLQFYDTIKPRNSSENGYTVLATINDNASGKLLAIATGTQANLGIYPNDIQDCHAESLVKRAYKRYLLDTLSLILSKSAHTTDIDQSIERICTQSLILFVTQFPCGLIKRYEGDEPLDEAGKPIRRKPGRGTLKDGKFVYVNKDSCLVKLDRWLKNGFQGKRLEELFKLQNFIKTISIGDCEPCDSFDYKSSAEELRKYFSCDKMPQIRLINKIRRDEFVYDPNKRPQPVALVWWSSPPDLPSACPTSKRRKIEHAVGSHEMIVDGRRRGLTKKQYLRGIPPNSLQISNHIMRRDLKRIEQLYCESRSGC